MQKGQVVLGFLIPAHQNAAEAIHPAVPALYHPPTRFLAGLARHRLSFHATRANVSREAKLLQDGADLIVVIALVQAQALRLFCRWFRPLDQNALESCPHPFHLVAVRARYPHADRDALSLRQETAFDTLLAALRRIRSGLFPPQGGLYSWRHPYSTMTNRCLATHRTVRHPPARGSQTRPPRPTPGSDRALWTWHRVRVESGRPTDSRYGAHRKWHPHTGDPPPAGVPHPSGGCSRVPATRAPALSTSRRRGESPPSSGCLGFGHDSA